MAEFWSFESLANFAKETKDYEVMGKMVTVRKLPTSVMINAGDNKDPLETILKGLVKPALTREQLNEMPVGFTNAVTKAIMDYSGLSGETAEKN